MERMTERGKNGYYVPADRAGATIIYAPQAEVKQRFEGQIVDRLGEYEQSGYDPRDFDKLCREMSNLRLKSRCRTYEEIKKKLDYPEYILRCLRQRLGMNPDDTSQDEMFQSMEPKRVFGEVVHWNGLLGGYDRTIIKWIKDIFGVDLHEQDS